MSAIPENRPSRSHHGVYCAAAWLICATLYLWTASGAASRYDDRANAWHHYEYLVDGFLQGHAYLSLEPDPALLALPNPWDPVQNRPYRLWDASLYHGKFYLYYGPAPALLLMLPWKVMTGWQLPQWLATGLFAAAGLGALARLLLEAARRYFPAISPLQLFFAVLLAGHVSWLPVVLRRPAFWELPIVAAIALLWLALYFFWKYHDTGGARRWAVAAGAALALSVGARPNYALTAGFVTLLFALPVRGSRPSRSLIQRLLPVVLPLAAGAVALLAYNFCRFGQPFEFGQRYQIWGPPGAPVFIDERNVQHFSLNYFSFNVWLYFFSVPELSPYFPFFRTVWPAELPPGYITTEEIHGLLFALPAVLLGAAALAHVFRHRGDAGQQPLRMLLAASAGASLLAGAVLCCFAGACSRYIAELMAGWSVVTGLGFLAVFSSRAGVLRLLAGAASVWSACYVWCASIEFRGFAQATQPGFYRAVAEVCNYPSDWVARRDGQVFGPVALDVRLGDRPGTGTAMLLAAGRPAMMNQLVIERFPGDELQLRLLVNDLVIVETPRLHHPGPLLQVGCRAPWLYPPAAHPYWGRLGDPVERQRRQTEFAIGVDGVWYTGQSRYIFDSTRFEPFRRTADSQPPACAWVERMAHLSAGDSAAKP